MIFAETRTVIKLDYYGQPYEAVVIGKKLPDRGELWKRFVDMQKEQRNNEEMDNSDHTLARTTYGSYNPEWSNREYLKQMIKNEEI